MDISKGIELIAKFEGFHDTPYLCPANVWTIGYGTTVYPDGKKVTKQDRKITQEIAYQYLLGEANKLATVIQKNVGSVKLNNNQISALVSFAYNLGVRNLLSSTLFSIVKENPNSHDIAIEFPRWKYATVNGQKKELLGLLRRRNEESTLYFSK